MPALSVTRIEPSGELATDSYIAAAAANQDSRQVGSGPVILAGYEFFNTTSSIRYVKLYNKAAPTSSDTPVRRIVVPGNAAGAGAIRNSPIGVLFSIAMGMRITTGYADNDTGTVTGGDVVTNIDYFNGVSR